MPIIILVVVFKFLLPLAFFKFPFQASWLNFIIDTSDGDILMHYGMEYDFYQTVDKLADYVTYILMFIVGRRWKIGKVITILFIYRTIGQVIYFYSRNDFYFFLFPNFLEPLFMIYSLLMYKYKDQVFRIYKKHAVLIWTVIIIYKMWNEYNIHVARHDLSQFFFGFNN